MKKLFLPAALMAVTAGTLCGQNKISPDGLIYLETYRAEQAELKHTLNSVAQPAPEVGVIVMLAEGYDASSLEALGYEVESCTSRTAIVSMPLDKVEEFALNEAVQSVSFGGKSKLLLDLARKSGGVDEAHTGVTVEGVTRSFKGAGVVLGMVDEGFQANHVNFIDDNGAGASRISHLWYFRSSNGTATTYTSTNIKNFTCDNKQESHATHVAGIMGGSYQGPAKMAYTATGSTTRVQMLNDEPMKYYGVAPEAELALSVGQLYDPNVISGVSRIINYAKQQGMPAVVNMSLGINMGPHDGTDNTTATLNELGKDAIICMAAGNEADLKMSITKTFTEDESEVKTFLIPASAYGVTAIDNYLDIWASDNQPLTVTVGGYNRSTAEETAFATLSAKGSKTISTGTGMTSGRISMSANVDANNNRYFVRMSPSTAVKMNSNSYFFIKVSGKPGQKINMYYSGYADFSSKNIAGYVNGTADESINNYACAENIISVGSYNTRRYFGILGSTNGASYTNNETVNKISGFSSYGTMPDGTPLPYILAPGATIISSTNRYYVESSIASQYYESPEYMTGSATSEFDGKTDYWGAMDGTSMACPYISGVVALWLQADPSLTAGDVKKIMAETSTQDSYTKQKPAASGYGKINAAAGLRYILTQNAAIGSVKPDDEARLMITATATGFDVVLSGEASFEAALYDMQGRLASRASGRNSEAYLPTDGLSAGVYVITVQGASTRLTRKVTVR